MDCATMSNWCNSVRRRWQGLGGADKRLVERANRVCRAQRPLLIRSYGEPGSFGRTRGRVSLVGTDGTWGVRERKERSPSTPASKQLASRLGLALRGRRPPMFDNFRAALQRCSVQHHHLGNPQDVRAFSADAFGLAGVSFHVRRWRFYLESLFCWSLFLSPSTPASAGLKNSQSLPCNTTRLHRVRSLAVLLSVRTAAPAALDLT